GCCWSSDVWSSDYAPIVRRNEQNTGRQKIQEEFHTRTCQFLCGLGKILRFISLREFFRARKHLGLDLSACCCLFCVIVVNDDRREDISKFIMNRCICATHRVVPTISAYQLKFIHAPLQNTLVHFLNKVRKRSEVLGKDSSAASQRFSNMQTNHIL